MIPLLSRIGGNAMPGAPVKASMSGFGFPKQPGWNRGIQFICIPPLFLQGVGFFYLPAPRLLLEEKLSA